jgi:pimeloyl-ACP methyl ester carboxylesterase
MRRFVIYLAAFLAALPSLVAATPTLETGEIEGALFTIAKPERWNARVLLVAHGSRPEGQPLDAALDTGRPPYSTLLAEGWVIGFTSFRRNGIILRDAIADLAALRARIRETYRGGRVYVMGDSMGGAIAARIAEHFPDDYAGALAVGAALQVQEPEPTLGLELTPRRPLLFLSNQSEISGPREYARATQKLQLPAVVWRVARDGHVNVNAAERLAALAALVKWAEEGVVPAAEFDATTAPSPGPSRARFHGDGTATGVVAAVDPVYGNLTLDVQPGDLARLEIAPRTWFAIVVGNRVIRTFYGGEFSSVKRGEWVAFPSSEGWLDVAINYGNAAANAKLAPGDTVRLRRLQPD